MVQHSTCISALIYSRWKFNRIGPHSIVNLCMPRLQSAPDSSGNRQQIPYDEYPIHEEDIENQNERILLESRLEEVLVKTEPDIRNFSRCFYVHAIVFETPIAVLEGLLRCLVFAVITIVAFLQLTFRCERDSIVQVCTPYLRESLLSIAMASTVIVPGTILFAYRDFHPEDNWDIHPIPTLFGNVDVRRFIIFSFGQGELASNIEYNPDRMSEDTWKGGIIWSPRVLYKEFVNAALQTYNPVVFAPR